MSDLKSPEYQTSRISSQEEIINRMTDKVQYYATQKLKSAQSLGEFLNWHQFLEHPLRPYIEMGLEYNQNPDVDYYVADRESEDFKKNYEKEERAVNEMRQEIDSLPESEGQIRVVLKRVRDKYNHYTYRAMAVFPMSVFVRDEVLDNKEIFPQKSNPAYIYFDPTNACVDHACDDLYKLHSETQGVFCLPYRDYYECLSVYYRTNQGTNEYVVKKGEGGVIKQDKENYLLMGLWGAFGNEKARARVSDFWKNKEAIKAV